MANLGMAKEIDRTLLVAAAERYRLWLLRESWHVKQLVPFALGLAARCVAESRAEALDQPGTYDAITARALDTLPGIIKVGGHLLKPGGRLLAMKGVRPDEEIAALPAGWQMEDVHALTVPGLVGERHLVIVARNA